MVTESEVSAILATYYRKAIVRLAKDLDLEYEVLVLLLFNKECFG